MTSYISLFPKLLGPSFLLIWDGDSEEGLMPSFWATLSKYFLNKLFLLEKFRQLYREPPYTPLQISSLINI